MNEPTQQHRLLRRQVKKYLPADVDPQKIEGFLDAINLAYLDFDRDIAQAENTLEQSSQELFKVNEELRKHVIAKTEEAEELSTRIESIVNSVKEVIFQTDLQGRWTYLNPAWKHITGYSIKESLEQPFYNFIIDEDKELSKQQLHKLLSGQKETNRYPIRYRTKHGQTRWVEAFVNLNHNEAGEVIGSSGTLNDVTDRIEAQNELKRLALVAEKTDNVVIVSDAEGKTEWVNKAFEKLTGYTQQEAYGKKPGDLLQGPETNANTIKEISEALSKGTSYVGEIYNYTKKGRGYWLSLSITPIRNDENELEGFIAIELDITSRKENEQRLFEAQQTLSFAIDGNGFGVWDLHVPSGTISFTDSWKAILGYQPDELENTIETMENLFHPDDLLEFKFSREQFETGQTDTYKAEYRMRTKQGNYIWVMGMGKAISHLPDGRPLRMIGINQNVTERKKAEEQLEAYASDLEKINAELDKFAYVVSHDLKAPLRAINNLSEWIEEDLEEVMEEENKEQMTLLRGRVNRMENLINGILQYSRAGRSKVDLKEVDTGQLVKYITDTLAKPENTHIEIDPNMPVIFTEELALEQVFTNFISNAFKYNNSNSPLIEISAESSGNMIRFAVSDNGPGIEPEFHEKIFVIFQTLQARDTVESTGVGLAIVKKIVEDKGGEVGLKSSPAEGSTFYFTWPKKEELNETNT